MTKRQIWRKYTLGAIVISLVIGALTILVGMLTNIMVEIIFGVCLIVSFLVWNNRATKRAWHAYYFNADGSPKRSDELI